MNGCPTDECLQELLSGSLEHTQRIAVEKHLDGCMTCQRRFEALTNDPASERWHRLHEQAQKLDSQAADPFLNHVVENLRRRLAQDTGTADLLNQPPNVTGTSLLLDAKELLPGEISEVPGYKILGELGRGGMGVVYRAHHIRLKRLVALKMVLAGKMASEEEAARFRREAETLAGLRHPNIIQVFDIGMSEGCLYVALELVDGPSLAKVIRGKPQTAHFSASIVEILARAVHYANEQGIVHRDLKPANILLQLADGVLPSAEGFAMSDLQTAIPKIADFGLAKRVHDGQSATQTGQVLGTPGYMAPEQALGKDQSIGAAVDIHSLGGILYELVTGRPPFQGESSVETLLQVVHEEPVPPSRLRSLLPRDLEIICLKCLQKEPANRYATAQALADDLHRFLAGEPIQARPTPVWEQAWKWARRRPAVAALSLGLAIVTLVGFILVLGLWRAAEANAGAETIARKAETEARRDSERLLAGSYLDQGISQCERDNVGTGLVWMVRSLELAACLGDDDLEHAARANLAAWRHHLVRLRAWLPNSDWVAAVAFSPDGKLALTGNKDKTARLWDVVTGQPIGAPLVHAYPVWAVAFSPDGHTILTGSGDSPLHSLSKKFRANQTDTKSTGEAQLWDLRTSKPLGAPLACPGTVVAVQFSKEGNSLLTVGSGSALVWRMASPGKLGEPASVAGPLPLAHPGGVLTATFDSDGNTVVTGGDDGTARQWDVATGRPIGQPMLHPGPVTLTAFQPARQVLLTGAIRLDATREKIQGGEARLWQINTCQPLGPPVAHRGPLKGAAFTADGQIVVTGGFVIKGEQPDDWGGEARIWDTATGQSIGPVLEHPDVVFSVAISPNGRMVATGSRDSHVRFWLPGNGQLLAQSARPDRSNRFNYGTVGSLTFSPNGQLLLAGNLTSSSSATLFEVPPVLLLPLPLRHKAGLTGAVFSPDDRSILTGSYDSTVRHWHAATGLPQGEPLTLPTPVWVVAFNPDGRTFLTSCGEDRKGIVQLWDAAGNRPRGKLLEHDADVFIAAFSPDGQTLLTGSNDTFVRLWDVGTGKFLRKWANSSGVAGAAFAPNGQTILTGGLDGNAQLWSTTTGQPLRSWKHSTAINGVAFSPNGRLIGTAGHGREIQMWEFDSEKPFGSPLFHSARVRCLAFSPDGRTLLTGSWDKTARLWDVATRKPIGPPLAHRGVVTGVAFSHDGKMLVTASEDGTAQCWELARPASGDVQTIRLWVEALTGLYLDKGGMVRDLDAPVR